MKGFLKRDVNVYMESLRLLGTAVYLCAGCEVVGTFLLPLGVWVSGVLGPGGGGVGRRVLGLRRWNTRPKIALS